MVRLLKACHYRRRKQAPSLSSVPPGGNMSLELLNPGPHMANEFNNA
jgi:hypothetical protein